MACYYSVFLPIVVFFFFFNDTATTEIYTLSLHDALPVSANPLIAHRPREDWVEIAVPRSEEHTSELQSRRDLVCRLLLEKKKKVIAACVGNVTDESGYGFRRSYEQCQSRLIVMEDHSNFTF